MDNFLPKDLLAFRQHPHAFAAHMQGKYPDAYAVYERWENDPNAFLESIRRRVGRQPALSAIAPTRPGEHVGITSATIGIGLGDEGIRFA